MKLKLSVYADETSESTRLYMAHVCGIIAGILVDLGGAVEFLRGLEMAAEDDQRLHEAAVQGVVAMLTYLHDVYSDVLHDALNGAESVSEVREILRRALPEEEEGYERSDI